MGQLKIEKDESFVLIKDSSIRWSLSIQNMVLNNHRQKEKGLDNSPMENFFCKMKNEMFDG